MIDRTAEEISKWLDDLEARCNAAEAELALVQAQAAQMRGRDARMEKALREIIKGEGRYSFDRLTHARNTIEDMKALAQEALREIECPDSS